MSKRARHKQSVRHIGISERTLGATLCKRTIQTIPHIRVGPRVILLDLDQFEAFSSHGCHRHNSVGGAHAEEA